MAPKKKNQKNSHINFHIKEKKLLGLMDHSPLFFSRYRKVVSNVCEGGLNKAQSAKQSNCPLLPPKGLQVGIKGQMLAVAPGDDITFIIHQEEVVRAAFLSTQF